MRIRILALAACASLGVSGLASAQDPLVELYGRAVHSYFRGNHSTAIEMLDDAITAGLEDPRAFYFRGLSNLNLAGMDTALADFEQGAILEMRGKTSVDVGRSLERIQGHARAEIEKARTRARLASRALILEQQRAKLDMLRKTGDGGVVVPPSGTNLTAPGTVMPGTSSLAPNDPFNTKRPKPVEEVPAPTEGTDTNALPTEPEAPMDDLFGDTPKGDAKPAAGQSDPDPFG